MTPITRRDALVLTTAATLAPTVAAAAPTADPKATIVIGDGVVDGSSIPIGLKIPYAALDPKNAAAPLVVTLQAQPTKAQGNTKYATVNLLNLTIAPSALGGDVAFATRLRLSRDFTKTPNGPAMKQGDDAATTALSLHITQNGAPFPTADPVEISFGPGNCPPADSSTLRVSVQPGDIKPKTQVSVKALAPRPLLLKAGGSTQRKLKSINLSSDASSLLHFEADDQYLSEDVYLAFSYLQGVAPAILNFQWEYSVDAPLSASLFLAKSE